MANTLQVDGYPDRDIDSDFLVDLDVTPRTWVLGTAPWNRMYFAKCKVNFSVFEKKSQIWDF